MRKSKIHFQFNAAYKGKIDRLFYEATGLRVPPVVANCMSCRVCFFFLERMPSGNWLCPSPRCGPVIPKPAMIERLMDEAGMKSCTDCADFLEAVAAAQKTISA